MDWRADEVNWALKTPLGMEERIAEALVLDAARKAARAAAVRKSMVDERGSSKSCGKIRKRPGQRAAGPIDLKGAEEGRLRSGEEVEKLSRARAGLVGWRAQCRGRRGPGGKAANSGDASMRCDRLAALRGTGSAESALLPQAAMHAWY